MEVSVISNNSVVVFKLRRNSKETVGMIRDITYLNGIRYKLYVKADGWFLNGESLNEALNNPNGWRKKMKNQWVFKCWIKSERIIKILSK